MANLKGRAPWYDLATGRVKDPLIIGVAGGSCSGKSEFCDQIKEEMGKKLVGNQLVCISEHSFYKTPPIGRYLFSFIFSLYLFFPLFPLLLLSLL